jgi:Uri superfamily endonuclease
MNGAYLLLIKLQENTTIMIGKHSTISFQKGFYLYVGSALNGLDQRIQRHLRKQKKMHWHIDYLLVHATIMFIFYKESETREECSVARALERKLCFVPGFGCSDCTCASHLFCGSYEDVMGVVTMLHMIPYPLHAKS